MTIPYNSKMLFGNEIKGIGLEAQKLKKHDFENFLCFGSNLEIV